MKLMKWNIVFLLSLAGAAMGIASLYGLTAHIEMEEWIVIALFTAYILSKQTTHKLFLHGVFIGIISGLAFSIIQTLFFSMYLKNNPSAATTFNTIFSDSDPKIFIVLTSPVIGGVYGVIIGAFSVAASRFHVPK
jgi:hypothetical protein